MPGRSKFPHVGLRPDAGSVSNSEEYIFSDATLGYNGSVFKIAPTAVRFEFNTDVINVTGEFSGNLTGSLGLETKMQNLSYVKGRMILKGEVPSSLAIGLANLETTEHIDVAFLLGIGGDRNLSSAATKATRLYIRVVPESVIIDWNLEKPTVGITITGRVSEKYSGKTHPVEEDNETL